MKRVLFVCTHNAARSQIAEGLLKLLGKGDYDVSSAGLEPADQVHPLAITALHERFIDTTGMKTKKIDDELLNQEFDLVITVCDHAKDHCPVFPKAKETLHWSIKDPAEAKGSHGERLEVFRDTRREIEQLIKSKILETP
ncbi:MAG: arsenate reductase ArsC [Candidatus Thorarchaeota archaeon]|nr:arsenate reductase ArsC [Candidatus Thorarchaeota archaeon]